MKSHVVLQQLLLALIHDVSQKFGDHQLLLKDVTKLKSLQTTGRGGERRVLTRICEYHSDLDAHLLQGLKTGRLTELSKNSRHSHSCFIPLRFYPLWVRIFRLDGSLRENFSIEAVKYLRQLLQFGSKFENPNRQDEDKKADKAIEDYRDRNLRGMPLYFKYRDSLIVDAGIIFRKVLRGLSLKNIRPSHGPGAVANGEKGKEKYVFTRYYSSLHSVYRFGDYMCVGNQRRFDPLFRETRREFHEVGVSKTLAVPKNFKGPRIITSEPLEFQWIQQGQRRELVRHIESHPITSGHVNFADQNTNGLLALASSNSGDWVTLDLKGASDYLHASLVGALLTDKSGRLHSLGRYFAASRTHNTVLPSGEVIPLSMFAGMGSAMCFPTMSLTIFCILAAALERAGFTRKPYVYGDDILVEAGAYEVVVSALTSVGLVVNTAKSFHTGPFRESCGVDACSGVDVTPMRVRKLPPYLKKVNKDDTDGMSTSSNAESTVAYAAYAQEAFNRGYDTLGKKLLNIATKSTRAKIKHVSDDNGASRLGRFLGTIPMLQYKYDGTPVQRGEGQPLIVRSKYGLRPYMLGLRLCTDLNAWVLSVPCLRINPDKWQKEVGKDCDFNTVYEPDLNPYGRLIRSVVEKLDFPNELAPIRIVGELKYTKLIVA